MKHEPAIPQDRPIVDAMRCSIPDDAEIWAKGPVPELKITKTPLAPGVFMTDFRKRRNRTP